MLGSAVMAASAGWFESEPADPLARELTGRLVRELASPFAPAFADSLTPEPNWPR
jgi:hypothetical protein